MRGRDGLDVVAERGSAQQDTRDPFEEDGEEEAPESGEISGRGEQGCDVGGAGGGWEAPDPAADPKVAVEPVGGEPAERAGEEVHHAEGARHHARHRHRDAWTPPGPVGRGWKGVEQQQGARG